MAKTFKLKIITPEKEVYSGEVTSFNTKTKYGRHEFLANHATAIMAIVPNVSKIKVDQGSESDIFISAGMIKFKENELVICTEAAEYGSDIDIARAIAAKERAEKRLNDTENKDRIDNERAKAALARALVRLEMKNYNH